MTTTTRWAITELVARQANADVTLNDALEILTSIVPMLIQDRDLTTPPAHSEGKWWIVASGATGAWASKDGDFAGSFGGGWKFITPVEGMSAWIQDEDIFLHYHGSDWRSAGQELTTAVYQGAPSSSSITVMKSSTPIQIRQIYAVIQGSASPSADVTLKFGPNRDGTGSPTTIEAAFTVNSITTGSSIAYASIDNPDVTAGQWVWFDTSNESGTITELAVELVWQRK